jgi:hypothetical protein
MAWEHEGRRRIERFSGRGEERDRHERGHDDRAYDRDNDERRHAEDERRRHWRGREYRQGYFDEDDEFERGRESGPSEGQRDRAYEGERGEFFRRQHEEGYGRHRDLRPYEWRGREAFRDDDRGAGPYVGRGPKGYRRSDERILEDVCERLTNHPAIDASDIEVKVTEGDVTLTGRVESRTVKHLAENMVETVSGVKEVHNQLRVAPTTDTSQSWQEPRERRAADPPADKTRRR